MRNVIKTGSVREQLLEVRDTAGVTFRVSCTGVATYDAGGTFIGADLTLRNIATDSTPDTQPAHQVDSLDILITQIQSEVKDLEEEESLLQSYFTAQIRALEVLLSRLLGLQFRDKLEACINGCAQRNGWRISMEDGLFMIDLNDTEAEVYHTLLTEAVAYMVSVVGQSVVAKEMQMVNEQMSAKTLELASQFGLQGPS
jgi:hypothetical protein